MLSQSTRTVTRQISTASRRGMATQASGNAFQTAEASGVKYASRDQPGTTSAITLVSRAGTRYAPIPGLAEGLQAFAFRNTTRRSALRIVREAELLGGQLSASYNRETVVFGARFLKEDLPYFVELLAESASSTKYQTHEFVEQVEHVTQQAHEKHFANPIAVANDAAHGVAFHRGLGTALVASAGPIGHGIGAETIAEYAEDSFAKENIAVVGNGVDSAAFSKWMNQFFGSSRSGTAATSTPTKYFGGQQRIESAAGNALVIAFPGSSLASGAAYKPELQVLAQILGGKSNIKWTPGFSVLSQLAAQTPGVSISTANSSYSDAGLFTITLSGEASAIASAAKEVVGTLNGIASNGVEKEVAQKAVAYAKFAALEDEHSSTSSACAGACLLHAGSIVEAASVAQKIAGVDASKVQSAAKALLGGKATVVAVGNLHVLPFAEELGLKV